MDVLRAALIHIILFFGITVAPRHVGFIDKIYCSNVDTNYIEKLDCWLMPNGYGYLTMNTLLVLKRDLWDVTTKYVFIVEHGNHNITFLSLEGDICKILSEVFLNPVLNLITTEIRQTSNYPLECPIKKDVKYTISNFTINSKYIPPFTPVIRWMGYCTMFTNTSKTTLLQLDTVGRVILSSQRKKIVH